jgi:hypothetical protein
MKSASFVAVALAPLLSIGPPPLPVARSVEVVASDYAFQIPRELPPGPTTFHFRNSGKVYHEIAIIMLKPGVTIEQFVQAVKDQRQFAQIDAPIGILFAAPGRRSTSGLSTELLPGRQYAVWCNFRDTTTAPRHFEMGMYSVIKAGAERAKGSPAGVKADTIVATDYSFRYPRTLSPGRHTLVFRNEGKVRHEVSIILPKKGVTFEQMFAVRLAGGNPRVLNDEQLGVLFAPPASAPLGRLDVNLLPGREYRIICVFMDDPKAPRHFELGMYGSIQVPAKRGG